MVAKQLKVSFPGVPKMHGTLDDTLATVQNVKEMVTEGVNPDPAMVTWVPLGPWPGVRVTVGVGAVIVNGVCALSNPPAEESEPYAVMV